MKKIFYILIALFSVFIFVDKVSAKVCQYSDGKVSLDVTIENDEISYKFTKAKDDIGNVKDQYNLKISDFNSNSSEKYDCLSEIRYNVNVVSYSNTKTYVFSSKTGSNKMQLINNPTNDEGSSNNNGGTNNSNGSNNDDDSDLTCLYYDDRIALKIKLKDDNLDYEISKNIVDPGLIREGKHKLNASDFIQNGVYNCLNSITYNLVEAPESSAANAETYTFAASGYLNKLYLKKDSDDDDGSDLDTDINSDVHININWSGCDVIPSAMRTWLIQALDLMKIVGLILAIILGMIDFVKAVVSGSADTFKKMSQSFAKRLIAVVLLFLLPLLIEFILGLISIGGIDPTNPLCGIK